MIRFFHRFRIIPGLRFNLSKRGTSVSICAHGFTATVGRDGTTLTASALGTGLSWRERMRWPR